MSNSKHVEIAVVGAGVAGTATAYYLCKKYRCNSIALIDSRDPMSYTSAQSGDNYRNWWPSSIMTQFTDHSIELMQELARESENYLQMKQGGYALATRENDIDSLLSRLTTNYKQSEGLIRIHRDANGASYPKPYNEDWASDVDGVDIVANRNLINKLFPAYSEEIETVLHIRRAGQISSQQMGEYMLQQLKAWGCSRLKAHVQHITKGGAYKLDVQSQDGKVTLIADKIINASGPYVAEFASMLDVDLPVDNVFHQKLAFEDSLGAVPRNQPFSIDIDEATLAWNDEERSALSEDSDLSWLTRPIDGGVHCRPEGLGKWIKLGWAYNRQFSTPDNTKKLIEDPHYNSHFPEIVLRGASRLIPSIRPYIDKLPANRVHYGGYYTMTKENWPLIGPLDNDGAFVVGALSGFGSMGACAAGSLCADWVYNTAVLPDYAQALSLSRYRDPLLVKQIDSQSNIGLL